jgi:hypothetical protein
MLSHYTPKDKKDQYLCDLGPLEYLGDLDVGQRELGACLQCGGGDDDRCLDKIARAIKQSSPDLWYNVIGR